MSVHHQITQVLMRHNHYEYDRGETGESQENAEWALVDAQAIAPCKSADELSFAMVDVSLSDDTGNGPCERCYYPLAELLGIKP